jgi:hypothetical protein
MNIIAGDLLRRIDLNRKRLSDDIYQSLEIFSQGENWPGDFQGRDILALCSLYKVYENDYQKKMSISIQLAKIFDAIDQHLNADGYFGPLFDCRAIDEQQVAGNSWYLRGLIEYYKLTKSPKYLHQIEVIRDRFLLAIAPYYQNYPIYARRELGGVGGHITEQIIDGWKISSDVGCAFIMLDGMSAVYEMLPSLELKTAIENIIDRFLDLDCVQLECQTHATLSCARGIFRFYQVNKKQKYLDYVIEIFNKYINYGLTYDYANINWFKHMDSWTEPCCIIDSLILAKNLFLTTGQDFYLHFYNRVYVNSLRTFQRDNGGAGCSTCAIDNHYALKSHLYEAFFCCTMRLAEGLYEMVSFAGFEKNGDLYIPFGTDFTYHQDETEIEFINDFYTHKVILIQGRNITARKNIFIYLPQGIKARGFDKDQSGLIKLSIAKNDRISVELDYEVHIEDNILLYGDMLLTKKKDGEPFYQYQGENYSPLYDNSQFSEEELEGKVQYVR